MGELVRAVRDAATGGGSPGEGTGDGGRGRSRERGKGERSRTTVLGPGVHDAPPEGGSRHGLHKGERPLEVH
jgi:hypothetical protein